MTIPMKPFHFLYYSICCLILLSGMLYSCQSQNPDRVILEKLDRTFNASKFYGPKIKRSEELLHADVKSMDKKELKEVFETAIFKKDTLAIFNSEGSLPTLFYIESTAAWGTRKLKPVKDFGYRYTTVSYNEEKDTVAILNGVSFPALTVAEDKNGEFAYLYALKTSKNKDDFQNIYNYLQNTFTKLKLQDDAGSGIKGWENKDFYYFLHKKNRREEQIFSFGEDEDDKPTTTDITDIRLEIYSKIYIQNMQKEQVYLPDYIPIIK